MIARRADVDATAKAAGLEPRLSLGRAIGAVGEHVRKRVGFVQKPSQLLAVVDCRVTHVIAPYQLVRGVHIHMVLVAVEAPPVLLGPSFLSFCRFLAGFFFHAFGVWPPLIASFSSRVFRYFGTETMVASSICPPHAA
jgi:hypothetical protein